MSAPRPFLGTLFEDGVTPVIEAGYHYSLTERQMHGIQRHGAIDFALPRGTKILVPADGWAVCTYGEVQLTIEGEPRSITLEQASIHSPTASLRPPGNGAAGWPAWYGSYVVQIWHGQGRYTQYAHVDWVSPDIPYFAPETDEHGNLIHNAVLRSPVKQLMAQGKRVRRGELLALSGMTGCGWGFRCYETAALTKDSRPDFRNSDYTYWDQPHLHFMVFSARSGKARRPRQLWDPFGLYGDVSAGYSDLPSGWSLAPNSLWL